MNKPVVSKLLIGLFLIFRIVLPTDATVINTTAAQGIGQSPGFPGNYAPNTQMRWIITLPDQNKFVSLAFTYLSVEGYSNAGCVYDWVQVVDGKYLNNLGSVCATQNNVFKPSIGLYCNFHKPTINQLMLLNTNKIVIEFCTDSVIQMQGFFFYWLTSDTPPTTPPPVTTTQPPTPTPTPPPTICGSTINLVAGQPYLLNSPGYPPGPYPNNLHCTWNVTSPIGQIAITTNFFDLEGYSSNCLFDKVVITRTDGTKAKFCQSSGPGYTNVGPSVTIEFITDTQIQRLGFQLILLAARPPVTPTPVNPHCGTTYNLNSVTDQTVLYSPGWPNRYPDYASCTWTITNGLYSSNFGIQFLFLSFNTEAGYDQLEVTPSGGSAVYFDGVIPANTTKIFNASSVVAYFHSDYVETYPGFHIVVTLQTNPFACQPGQYKCKTVNQCISGASRCDGHQNCPDNSDENSLWCLMPQICGKMVIQPNIYVPGQRIVNGTIAKPGSWPWTLSVHYKYSGNQFCDAVLISPHWVLSAAHCFYGETGNPSQYIIKVGSFHDYQNDPPYEIDIGVKQIWIHPQYNSNKHIHDISVVRLAQEVPFNGKFNNHTGVACLPKSGYIVPAGTNCVVTGWGTTAGTGSSRVMRQAVIPIVSNTVCNSTKDYNGRITPDMICAGYPHGGEDTCQGDSGGPLVCKDASSSNWVLQGLTSWGIGCAEANHPGVYARTSLLTDFVTQVINDND